MNCCTILLKIKDFIPKLSKIPYENFICIFTNEDFEGRISLMQYEYQHINHEIKDIKSDIIYKIKVIDIISKKIIGISEHCIKYNIINNLDTGTSINFISQIRILPNQKNKQKISSNLNTNNKLNLTISTEIIKFNKTPINYIIKENSEFLKLNLKLHSNFNNNKKINAIKAEDNNYNTIKIKRINTNINKNKYNLNINEDIKNNNEEDKNNINLNMHNITVQNYYTINSTPSLNVNSVKSNKIYIKKYFRKNNNKLKELNENKNILKQNEINYNNIKIKKQFQSSTHKAQEKYDYYNTNNDYFNSFEFSMDKNNLTNNSIKVGRTRILKSKKRKKKYNNNSFKVINYSKMKNKNNISFDKIRINKKRYMNTSIKKDYSNNKIISDRIKTLEISSYNMSYTSNSFIQKHKYNNKLESIISPKNSKIKENSIKRIKKDILANQSLSSRLKNNKSKDDPNNLKHIHVVNLKSKNNGGNLHKKNNQYRKEFKNHIKSLFELYILLNKKLKKYKESSFLKESKFFLEKEKILNLLDKKNIIEQKKYENQIKRYIYINIHSKMNNQIISQMNIVKNKEFNIFKTIFNTSISKEDMINQAYKDKILQEDEKNKINLYLDLLRNTIKYYGNISQIYNNDINKKSYLLYLLINNGIEINNSDFLYKKNKSNCKEIKEELDEEIEEESLMDLNKDSSDLKKSIKILDKLLIYKFPLKYENITNKKFTKINPNSNEYLFNNEIKLFAFYNKGKVLLKVKNKDYSLGEFVNSFIKKKNENSLIYLQNNRFKMNSGWEKYSRNHKNMNEVPFKCEIKKKLFKEKILHDDNIINKNNNIKKEE